MVVKKGCLEKYIDFRSVAVASTTLGAELLGKIYVFYYLKVFLNIYSLNGFWLNVAQTLYLVWNAINDPIFGYMQDVGCFGIKWLMNRRRVILYGGPFYAIFFMFPWIPWTRTGEPSWLVGLHLIVCLFFFDGIQSLVLSAQCGLFTELTTKHSGRVRIVIYMEICSLIGSFVILPVDAISKSVTDFKAFQITTSVVAMISMFFFWYTGYYATDEIAQVQKCDVEEAQNSTTVLQDNKTQTSNALVNTLKVLWINSKGIFTNRNFWCVVSGNFFHILRITANSNFLAIFTETLVSVNGVLPIGSFELSAYYTLCNILPKLVVILIWPLLKKFGAWNTMMCFATLTVVNSTIAFSIGRFNYISILSFLLFESIFSQSIWPAVYNIFFPDVVDEDMKINNRSHPFSTTIFTMNALITTPTRSLAPIIIVAVLNKYGYEMFQDYRKQLKDNFIDCTGNIMTSNEMAVLTNAMFGVVCWFPAICAILEIVSFIPYKMKCKHREEIKAQQNRYTNIELVENKL